MRILFATDTIYLPQRAGGTESSVHDLCIELQKRHISVAVLSALKSGDTLYVRNRIKYKLHKSIDFPIDTDMGYPAFRGWTPVEGVNEVLRRFKPTVVITQGNFFNLANAFLNAKVPTILYLRNAIFEQMHAMGQLSDGIGYLANSQFMADKFERKFGIKATVIPPLVRPEAYRTSTSRRKVIFINPHPFKGVDVALKLAKIRPDIGFEFIDCWPLADKVRSAIEARARALENVKWRKPVSDMRKVYRKAKIVLVPSQWEEAWARVVTEAHINGIPVVASDRGGLPESVGPGGILVNPEAELSEWADALSRLWDDRDEYETFSQAALEYSKRPLIQPSHLISRLLNFISAHISKSRHS